MKISQRVTALALIVLLSGQSPLFAWTLQEQTTSQTTSSSSQTLSQWTQSQTNAQNLVDLKNGVLQTSAVTSTNQTQSFYDAAGRLVREDIYTSTGKLKQRNEYFYMPSGQYNGKLESYFNTTNGRLTTQKQYDASNALIAKIEFSYDSKGRLSQTKRYNAAGALTQKITYTYNTLNLLTVQREYDGSGRLLKKIDFVYDSSKRLTLKTETSYNLSGQVTGKIEFFHDTLGKLTLQKEYNAAGQLIRLTQFSYDTSGVLFVKTVFEYTNNVLVKKIEYFHAPAGALTSQNEYEYDSTGRVTRKIFLAFGSLGQLTEKTESLYDTNNRVTRKNTFDPVTGALQFYETYLYDASGNVLSIYHYSPTGTMINWKNYSQSGKLLSERIYDVSGRFLEMREFDEASGALIKKWVPSYNSPTATFPEFTTVYSYDPVTGLILSSYVYDTQQRRLRDDTYVDGVLLSYEVYIYEAYTVIEKERYSAAGILEAWTIYSTSPKYGPCGGFATGSVVIEYDPSGNEIRRTFYDQAGNVIQIIDQTQNAQQSAAIELWFGQNQNQGTSGLVSSYPNATGFIYHDGVIQDWAKIYANTQAYTYDQALAGMTFLEQGNFAAAKRIFDFYYAQWQAEQASFNGFWTVYNTDQNFHWKKYEWRKGMGESVWIGLFCLQYEKAVSDVAEKGKSLDLAAAIGRWASSLPHKDGAVAMSPPNPGGNPDFGNIYSVENNLDYYVLTQALSSKAPAASDRERFIGEFANLKNWLKTTAYDSATGLFRTGGSVNFSTGQWVWDSTKSLDVNSWAISTIGIPTLVNEFGINMDNFISKIHLMFAVQDNGTFGGNILTAKGFDFSDSVNASLIGRSGMKWVEGTNQMILAYKLLAEFYKDTDLAKSNYYRSLADHFSARNADNAVNVGSALSYLYTDRPDTQIYYSTPSWRTSPGQSAPSTAWVYFALNKFNPFEV